MKTKHRNASHAKRRWQADPMSIVKLMDKVEPFTDPELVAIKLHTRIAFESIKSGRGTMQDVSDIASAVNTTMVRAEAIDPLCLQTAAAAKDALLRCLRRFNATGKVGFDGPAIAEVEIGLELYEQILSLSTRVQMANALRQVRIRSSQMEVSQ